MKKRTLRFSAYFLALLAIVAQINCDEISFTEKNSSIVKECSLLLSGQKYGLAIAKCSEALTNAANEQEKVQILTMLSSAHQGDLKPFYAQRDLQEALQIEPQNKIALQALARLSLKMGDFREAKEKAEGMPDLLVEIEKVSKLFNAIQSNFNQENWTMVDQKGAEALREQLKFCLALYDLRIISLHKQGNMQKAIDLARTKIHLERDNSETFFLMAKIYFANGELKNGLKYTIEAIKLNPEMNAAKALRKRIREIEQQINEAENKMLLKAAVDKLDALLKEISEPTAPTEPFYDPNFTFLLKGLRPAIIKVLCLKKCRRKEGADARTFCTEAMDIDTTNKQQYLLYLAEMYIAMDDYEQALKLLNQARGHQGRSQEIRTLQEKAEKKKKEKQATKYYDLLGVSKNAEEKDIKRAYKQMARKYHPDKAPNDALKEEYKDKMMAVNDAYGVLSDPKKRQQYDHGIDPNDPMAGQGGNPFYGGFGGGRSGHTYHFNMNNMDFGQGGRGRGGGGVDFEDIFRQFGMGGGGGGQRRRGGAFGGERGGFHGNAFGGQRGGGQQRRAGGWNFHDDL